MARRFDWRFGIDADFTENTVDTCDCVEQIGRGVALEAEEAIPTKDVVLCAVAGKVGVFYCTNTNGFSDLATLGFVEVWIFLGDDVEGAVAGFVEEFLEFNRFAGLGFKGLLVGPENGAPEDVVHLWLCITLGLEPFFGGEKKLLEMILLAGVGQVDDLVGLKLFQAIKHGRQIGRGVVTGAVLLTDIEGKRALVITREFFDLVVPDDQCAVALFGEADFGQLGVDALHFVAVERFAEGDVDLDADLHE